MDELSEHHVAPGGSPCGWLEVSISLLAEDVVQATRTAAALAAAAVGPSEPVSVEVTTEAERGARVGSAPVPELLSVGQA